MFKIKLIVICTPLQSLNVERVITSIQSKIFVVIVNTSTRPIKKAKKNIHIQCNTNIIIGFLSILLLRLLAILRVLKITNAMVAHPYHPFSNWLFTSPQIADISIIEDGLANYYNVNVNAIGINFKNLKLKCFLLGYRYSSCNNEFTPDIYKVKKGYFYSPEIAKARMKNKNCIKYTKKNYHAERYILILDQPIHLIGSYDREATVVRKLLDEIHILQEQGYSVFIKNHPAQEENRKEFSKLAFVALLW